MMVWKGRLPPSSRLGEDGSRENAEPRDWSVKPQPLGTIAVPNAR